MQKSVRASNIELCRIVCMLFVIAHHCVWHGGAVNMELCTNKIVALLLYPGGKLCFDTFIVISMWYLVDASFKTVRFAKVWFETLLYSLLTTIIAFFAGGGTLSVVEIGSAFFPISGGVQGYVQTYLAFYLLMPFLSKISRNITKNQTIMLLAVLSVYIFLVQAWQKLIWSEQSVYSRLGLFVFFYFLMLYLKRNPIAILKNRLLMGTIVLCCWFLIFAQRYFSTINETSMWRFVSPLVSSEEALVNIIGGVAFFSFFKELKVKSSRIINTLGGTTLAVLLLHDGHFSRKFTWVLFRTSDWYYSKFFVIYVIGCTIGIYIVCSLIDLLRKKYLENKLFQLPKVVVFCERIDSLIRD